MILPGFFLTRCMTRTHSLVAMEKLWRKQAKDIFLAAVNSVRPNQLINKCLVETAPATYKIGNKSYKLDKNVYVVGFGKAVLCMARAVENVFGEHIVRGVVSVPTGSQDIFKNSGQLDLLLEPTTKIRVFEGAANNMPDANAQTAANAIADLVSSLKDSDLLVVLISGGGSALLPAPIPPVTLQEKYKVIGLLTSRGANITELNIVRKQLSLLKGGGLARLAYPAKVVTFILSDVINDPLDIIASGPTVPNPNSLEDVWEIVDRLGIRDKLPSTVLEVLSENVSNSARRASDDFTHVTNNLIGSNAVALKASEKYATSLGFCTTCLTNNLQGEARDIGELFAHLGHAISACYLDHGSFKDRLQTKMCRYISPDALERLQHTVLEATRTKTPVCILAGGETTVTLTGSGIGGRSQELALSCGIHLKRLFSELPVQHVQVTFLSAGTDGIDGPTDAAGASTTHKLISEALASGYDAEAYLANNDSNTFYINAAKEYLVKTGHTGTNVMDVQVLIVAPE